jgi:hypothetical protein
VRANLKAGQEMVRVGMMASNEKVEATMSVNQGRMEEAIVKVGYDKCHPVCRN